jgi:peptidylprolyl isomerase
VRRSLAVIAAALLLTTAACGGGDSGKAKSSAGSGASKSQAATGDTITGVSVSGTFGAEPKLKVSKAVKVTKPETKVISTGTGNPVEANKAAMFDMYVARGRDGQKIFNSSDRGVPTQATMQSTQGNAVSKVLTDALVGKRRGSRVVLAAPATAVFGPSGAPQYKLKATDSVLFVFDLLSVQPKQVLTGPQGTKVKEPAGEPVVQQSGGKVTGLDFSSAAKKAPTKLQVIPLVKGTGPAAKPGTLVTFNYYGAVWGSKKAFDSSFTRGAPAAFGIGVHSLIPAWDKAIPGLKRGSRVLIIAPPKDAYGSKAQTNIPANSTLAFVVDVLGVDS